MPEKPFDTKSKKTSQTADQRLWVDFTRDITPLRAKNKVISSVDPTIESFRGKGPVTAQNSPPKQIFSAPPVNLEALSGHSLGLAGGTGGKADISVSTSEVDKRTKSRFEKGAMAFDGKLDLHGLNEERAYNSLCHFLDRHIASASRCVLVITGQGRSRETGLAEGVLRQRLPLWVLSSRFSPHILSVAQAQQKHGGAGAFYILLKRQRQI